MKSTADAGDNAARLPFTMTATELATELAVDPHRGLTQAEAEARLRAHGPNSISSVRKDTIWKLLLGQVSGIIVWLLVAAAVIAWFTESQLEAVAILIVLLINILVGFGIEWRASRSLDALRDATRTKARVRRDKQELMIDAAALVAGDIVSLTAGDRVPADCLLVEAVSLEVDESSLTGESAAVTKSVGICPASAPLAERTPMIYLGSNVVRGHAVAVVAATGARTEIGRIGELLRETVSGKTPLEHKLGELGKRLVYIVLVIASVIMFTGILRGDEWWLMMEVAISLAVAAVPEGLPAVTTLILGLGVLRMARRKAVVRKLAAVETLGSTTVICTDKTGTLTENRMTVREYQLSDGAVVTINEPAAARDVPALLLRILRVSVLCNEVKIGADAELIGDPTETALLEATGGFDFDDAAMRRRYSTIYEEPFEAGTKRMIVVAEDENGNQIATIKGAPAVILNCSREYIDETGARRPLDPETRQRLLELNETMASRALRVLAFADCEITPGADLQKTFREFVFLGFAGMSDPPRDGVFEAIEAAHFAGIRVVMLTGDQLATARAIAHELGLSRGADVFALHSDDLRDSDSTELAEMARKSHVFARVSPEDKLRIVVALQDAGEIVAVTGDGVNDAPALKRADVGVAMGQRGTEVAKESADIVLTDDNFATIVAAIEGGRTIYANIRKFVRWMFASNFAEVLVIFVPIAAGYPLPLLPLQILWVNLVTDVFPALALAVEPASAETMKRAPRAPDESLVSRQFLLSVSWQAVLLALIVIGIYGWALHSYGSSPHARTIALMALIGVQIGHLFNCRAERRSAFSGFFRNPYIFGSVLIVIILQALALYFQPLMRILGTVSPNVSDYLLVGIAVVLPIIIVEVVKFFGRRTN